MAHRIDAQFAYSRKRKLREVARIEAEYQKRMRDLVAPNPTPHLSFCDHYRDHELFKQKVKMMEDIGETIKYQRAVFARLMQARLQKEREQRHEATTAATVNTILSENCENMIKLRITNWADRVNAQLKQLEHHLSCEKQLNQVLSKNKFLKKAFNAACSQVTLCSDTWSSIRANYVGTDRRYGPKLFLQMVKEKAPELLETFYIGLSNHILKVFIASLDSAKIKAGEIRFSLVYLSLMLMVEFAGFSQQLIQTIYSNCPAALPGNGNHMNKGAGAFSSQLLNMQGYISFLAALIQVKPKHVAKISITSQDLSRVHDGLLGLEGELAITEGWKYLSALLNSPMRRSTPYLISAFLAVSGYEMSNEIGEHQMKKFLKTLISQKFTNAIKSAGSFDKDTLDNDFDRFAGFKMFVEQLLKNGCKKPGLGRDARVLVENSA